MNYIIFTTRTPGYDTDGSLTIRVRGVCPDSGRVRLMKFTLNEPDAHKVAAEKFVRTIHWEGRKAPGYSSYGPPALGRAIAPAFGKDRKAFIYKA
jgi:hypothetical protein